MEKGSLRCDANISLRPAGEKELGVKVEVKNMNSFKGVKAALRHEETRQADAIEDGELIIQQTRLWDPAKKITQEMRSKEEAHDYRYFPEPDLVPYFINSTTVQGVKELLPELPEAKKSRFVLEYEISDYDAGVLVSDKKMSDYFEECVKLYNKPKALVNWLTSEVLKYLNINNKQFSDINLPSQNLIDMLSMIDSGIISSKIAKDVIVLMIESDRSPKLIVEEDNLLQISNEDDLRKTIKSVISANGKAVLDFKSGKVTAITFLVGQVMRATKGKANPSIANKIVQEELESS